MENLLEIQNILRDYLKAYFTEKKIHEIKILLSTDFNKNDPTSIEYVPGIHLVVRKARIADLTPPAYQKQLILKIILDAIIGVRNQNTVDAASINNLGNYLQLLYRALLEFKHGTYKLNVDSLKNTDHIILFTEKTNNAYLIVPFEVTMQFSIGIKPHS